MKRALISYEDLVIVTQLLRDFPAPWFVSGGWAIDLFRGEVSREHEDLEIGIFRQDQHAIQRFLPSWILFKAVEGPDGGTWAPWLDGEWLELPVFQVLARRKDTLPSEFEFFLNDVVDAEWCFRRNMDFRRPVADLIVTTSSGIPILAPEIQLLYKARGLRPKDERDFSTVLGSLDPERRAWLRAALETNHPGHAWIPRLLELE
jgi:hypothetical protein